MPAEIPSINCQTDSECQPQRINRTFAVAESVHEGCDYQVTIHSLFTHYSLTIGVKSILRLKNQTSRILDRLGNPIEGQAAGEVLLQFDGWLRDVALKKTPRAVQHHKKLGILVSAGNKVLRFDPITGDFIQELVQLNPDDEITCFHVE